MKDPVSRLILHCWMSWNPLLSVAVARREHQGSVVGASMDGQALWGQGKALQHHLESLETGISGEVRFHQWATSRTLAERAFEHRIALRKLDMLSFMFSAS